MTKIAVVYHSGYGHTDIVARAVAKGAGSSAEAALIAISAEGKIADPEWEILKEADGIIFGSPTYMGAASGPFKIFADASSKPWFAQEWKDKVAGGFTNSHSLSGDKQSTLQQFATLAAQHGMIWVSLGELPAQQTGAPHQRDGMAVNRLGSFMGVMTQAENVAPEESLPEGDIITAEIYGERVAKIAAKMKSRNGS